VPAAPVGSLVERSECAPQLMMDGNGISSGRVRVACFELDIRLAHQFMTTAPANGLKLMPSEKKNMAGLRTVSRGQRCDPFSPPLFF